MNKMTEDNLKAAYAGESQAHIRYINFSERAEKEGFPNVARLFHAAAFAERIHASNHLKALDGIKKTAENLAEAIAGETFEFEQMYPAYLAVAEMQGEKRAQRSMLWANEAEKLHARLYTEAKQAVAAGKDLPTKDIWVCTACGYTLEGDLPDVCPICGARHDKFRKF